MRSARRYAIIVSALVVLIMIYLSAIQLDRNSVITDKETNNYIQTYIETYNDLAETYIHQDNRTYLKFYNGNPYFIRAFVSTKHGAGLEFIPSKTSSSKIEITNKQIEEYFFNGNVGWPMFEIAGRGSIGNLSIESNGHPFVKILENGSILFWNLRVNGKLYDYTIIKGSNLKKDWTNQTASEDALYNFKNDLINAFAMSEEFRRYLAMPVLTDMANKILDREKNGYYVNNYLLYKSDFEELYNIAKEYRVNGQFAEDIYNFNENQKKIPSWWDQYNVLGIPGGILTTIIIILIVFFKNKFLKLVKKTKTPNKKSIER
jgi:hypothetical protein